MLVDDEESLSKQAKIFLEEENENLEIHTFKSPENALEELKNGEDFDAIVSDYQMPGLDGIELLKIIREERNSDIPFLIFTGKGREEVAMEALNLGADRYIRKGGDPKSQYALLARSIEQAVEHREAESKLQQRIKAMESSIDGIAILDENQRYSYVNQAHAEIYGYDDPEELIGQEWGILELARFKEEVFPILKEEGEWRGEEIGQRKDGSTLPVELSLNLLENGKIICVVRDITDRKRIEDQLRESEERFKRFFREQADAIFIHTARATHYGEILEVNPSAIEQTGYSEEELIGMNVQELTEEGPENQSQENVKNKILNGETVKITEEKKKKSGEIYWTEVVKTPIQYKGVDCAPSINRDITERKRAQEREAFLHSLLRHDLRNKAQIVQGYLDHLSDTELTDTQQKLLKKALDGNEKGIELIEKVRTMRKVAGEEGISKVKLDPIIEDVIKEHKNKAESEDISIIHNDSFKYTVQGGSLLRELFSNIIGNSIQHSNCNKIEITSRENDGQVIVTISDDGKGIPDDIKSKIFEKGYKKGESSGSGLGMHLAKRIAKTYGGDVNVSDSEMDGAKFKIKLNRTG